MVDYEEYEKQRAFSRHTSVADFVSQTYSPDAVTERGGAANLSAQIPMAQGIPTLTLYNPSLDIRIVGINGAVIGRRQGPYMQMFENNMYISGVHAQLIYKPDSGWCIIDKHSSNGTKLNQRDLLPDVPMSLKSGDIVALANINMQVSVQ